VTFLTEYLPLDGNSNCYVLCQFAVSLCVLTGFAGLRKNTEITEYVERVIFLIAVLL
jgi:hypothetical protein